MHRTNVAPVLPATKGEFQKAGFVFVQPFVTTLGCARVGAQVHGSDMMIPDNEADSISGSTAKSLRRFLLIHSGYWYQMCKTRNQSLPDEGGCKSNELCSG